MNSRGSVATAVVGLLLVTLGACEVSGSGEHDASASPTPRPNAAEVLRDGIAAVKAKQTGLYSVTSRWDYGDFGTDGGYDLSTGAQRMDLSGVSYGEKEADDEPYIFRRRVVDGAMFVQYEDIKRGSPCWVDATQDPYYDRPAARHVEVISFLESLRATSISANGIEIDGTVPLGVLEETMYGSFGDESDVAPAALELRKPTDHRVPVHVRLSEGHVDSVTVDMQTVVTDLKNAKIDVAEMLDNPGYLEELNVITVRYYALGDPLVVERPQADEMSTDDTAKCPA